ncbi:MAG: phosphodiesterase, partial [Burkholderiales bacterium]
ARRCGGRAPSGRRHERREKHWPPVLIAHISDTHITPPGQRLAGRLDSAERLAQAVRTIQALDVRPDCVLATGDLTDRGESEAYVVLRRTLAPLPIPVYAIPGNHDRREPMRQAFADCAWMPSQPGTPLCFRVRLKTLMLIALDTLVEGEDYGMLGEGQLEWLEAQLGEAATQPVIVMLHHPPVDSGIAIMDAMKLRDSDHFGDIVSRHGNIERILCGHLHRSMHVRWRGTMVSVPSSTGEQVRLTFAPDVPLASLQEPAGLQLHYWAPGQGLVSHNVPIGDFAGPFFY